MPEGVNPYPRWQGTLRRGPAAFTIAAAEVRRAIQNTWTRTLLTIAFAYVVIWLGQLWAQKTGNGSNVHTMANFLTFIGLLRWAALGVAATMAGPALLEDSRRGALELYLSRAVTRADYLTGKVLAVVGLTWLAISGPALLYYGASWALFDQMPDNWNWVPLTGLGYGLVWALVVAGAGLGLSCLARSSRAASIILFGGITATDIVLGSLLAGITNNPNMRVLSPFDALAMQLDWMLPGFTRATLSPAIAAITLEWWWGLLTLGVVGGLGWLAVALRHPRLPGVE